ncbi:MAG: hypothetical protein IH996_05180 [Proteobacteria bacterium]|nr:hypothetical protein [Pseudomonadota bacterium]
MIFGEDLQPDGLVKARSEKGRTEIRLILEITRAWSQGTIKYRVIDYKERGSRFWSSDPEEPQSLPLDSPEVPTKQFLLEAISVIPRLTEQSIFEEGVRYRMVSSGVFFDVIGITDSGVHISLPNSKYSDFRAFWQICIDAIERDDWLDE